MPVKQHEHSVLETWICIQVLPIKGLCHSVIVLSHSSLLIWKNKDNISYTEGFYQN